MKAATYSSYGGPDVIEVHQDAPKPTLKDAQVLVEVCAASLNPFDYKLRRGYMKDIVPLTFPVTIGGDFSGIVTKVATGVTEYAVGDEVYGQAIVLSGASGSTAEFAAANSKNITRKPNTIDFVNAASLVLAGASAVQGIEEHIKLSRGEKIFISGGAGGIGSIAIQIAKHIGAHVATTVGTDDVEFAKTLGADEVIDYKHQKFEEILKDYDAVFDMVGGETTEKSFQILKKGGVLVSMAGNPDENKAKEYEITAIGQNSGVKTSRLNRLTELVEAGVVKPQVDKVFPIEKTRDAYDYLENGSPNGKVVIQVKA